MEIRHGEINRYRVQREGRFLLSIGCYVSWMVMYVLLWIQVLEYCEIMDAGGEHDKQMPNGVGARELTVGLEEEYTNEIEQPADL